MWNTVNFPFKVIPPKLISLLKGTYILPSNEVKRQYYNHICVFSAQSLSHHVQEDWWRSYWAIIFIHFSPEAFSFKMTSLSISLVMSISFSFLWLAFFSPSLSWFCLLYPLGFLSQTCPTDVYTGWTRSCTCCPVWIWTETTAKSYCPPRITLDTRSPSLSLRYTVQIRTWILLIYELMYCMLGRRVRVLQN